REEEAHAARHDGAAEREGGEVVPERVEDLARDELGRTEELVAARARRDRDHAALDVAVAGGDGPDEHLLLLDRRLVDAHEGVGRHLHAVDVVLHLLLTTTADEE